MQGHSGFLLVIMVAEPMKPKIFPISGDSADLQLKAGAIRDPGVLDRHSKLLLRS